MSAPESATTALERHRPTVVVNAGLMDDADTMSRLSPVARRDRPSCVRRNSTSSTHSTAVMAAACSRLPKSPGMASAAVKIVFSLKKLIFGFPITIRLTEYSAVMVMIPARIGCTPSFVCKSAVTNPASAPQKNASTTPSSGWPCTVNTADTAAPSVKVPSVVRSAMSSVRNEIYRPSATRA